METTCAWARETFGQAKLADKRLVSRLIDTAAAGAERPGGTVTKVMCTVAQKEAAFRFLESERLDSEAIAAAMFESTAQKCSSPITYVAMDQTSLSFTDRDKSKPRGWGRVVTAPAGSEELWAPTRWMIGVYPLV